MPEILLLPEKTRTRLRSTQIITSLPQLISELLQNALDAGAKHVDTSIDCEEWTCTVRDDGVGIPREGLKILSRGGEEGRYGTSKAYNERSLEDVSTFGFRGEALASVAEVSCLEISSRIADAKESWSIIMKGGQELYFGPAIRWRRESPGTVVHIRDAFYNLPIRRTSHTAPARTIELVKREIERAEKNRVLTILPTGSTLKTFKNIYGAALIEHIHEINVQDRGMTLRGFISLVGAFSKSHQHLFVNRHPMSSGDIHHAIESRFAMSSFSKHAYDEEGITQSPRPATRRSPRKNERRPVFVLNLDVPPSQFDNCIEPTKSSVQFKNSQDVISFVSNAIQEFLVSHGFAPAASVERSPSASLRGSPRKRARNGSEQSPLSRRTHQNSPADSPISFCHETMTPAGTRRITWGTCAEEKDHQPTDVFFDVAQPERYREELRKLGKAPDRYTLNSKSLKSAKPRSQSAHETPAWLSNVLNKNAAYTSSESRTPSITPISNPLAPTPNRSRHNMKSIAALLNGPGTDTSRRITRTDLASAQVISQVDNKFIACLIRSPSDRDRSQDNLILIDQHAADERVRVERFLEDLCAGYLEGHAENRKLVPDKLILVTERETKLLRRKDIQEAFFAWGFTFTLPPETVSQVHAFTKDEGESYVQVGVQTVPDIVGDKLLLGDELKEFVKSYMSRLEGLESREYPTQEPVGLDSAARGQTPWLNALRFCPPELLDLVNSKACRGAIMFNDPLELDQCERLVFQLSKTVYPFQCAHGRPTLVPLTVIKGSNRYAKAVDWSRLETG